MESLTYKGNYSDFVNNKEEDMLIQFEHFKDQQKKIKAMEKAIKDLRDWAIRADNNKFFRRAASMQKRLDKMERIERPEFDKQNMKLGFQDQERSGNVVIKAENLSKSYDGRILFEDVDLLIAYGERTSLIGPNGSGKTTFIRLLLGEEQASSGTIGMGSSVKWAYLPQIMSFGNEELTVLQCFREDLVILEGKAREYLSKFMFFGSTVFKKVKHLSGGERIRLKLSMLLYTDINLLILDEPTNHLDIASIETLEAALEDFKGTIFFISHDRYFINKFSSRVIAIEKNYFESYSGNYDFYVREKQEKKEQIERVADVNKIKKERVVPAKASEFHKESTVEVGELEKTIHALEYELSEIETNKKNKFLRA